ncbi:MAG: hypothetical protein WD009_00215 [Phycisphaeraceae bacterium]
MNQYLTSRRFGLAAAAMMVVGVVAAVSTMGLSPSLAQEQQAGEGIKVGLFNFRQVVDVHFSRHDAEGRIRELQAQAQQAQQAQDQQAAMQTFQQMQQIEAEYFDDFQNDLSRALEGVVEESGAQIIAVQVVDEVDALAYTADNVETEDVTNLVIREITDGEVQEAPAPEMFPGAEQQQQQQQQQPQQPAEQPQQQPEQGQELEF